MDLETVDPDTVPTEDPLMIDESVPVASDALGPSEQAQYIVPDATPAECSTLGADPAAEKQYHDLKPAVSSRAAQDAPSLLAVKQEACLGLPLVVPSEQESAAGRATRRSRRLAVETMPFKKRKRIIAPELDQDEYLLPEHVQDQVERAAPPASGRRLRPKRAAQLAASVEVDHQSPEPPEPEPEPRPPSPSPKVELKKEPATGASPVTGGGETVHGDAPPPRKKRGRPRKSQAPQRCAPPPEDDVTAAGDGDREARQQIDGGEEEREEKPAQPRRGRKSAAPARRRRPPGRPPSTPTVAAASPAPAVPDAQTTSHADGQPQQQQQEEDATRSPSPPAVEVSRVGCSGLPVSRPLTLTDQLRLLEVPNKRRQRPCPFCGSLTGCAPPDLASEHSHAPDTELTPRRRLQVVVDGSAPSDAPGHRRLANLADQDEERVSDRLGTDGRWAGRQWDGTGVHGQG